MGEVSEIQLHIGGPQEPSETLKDTTVTARQPPSSMLIKHWKWWLMVTISSFFTIFGGAVATLLGRLYYEQGGSSKWLATLVQSAGGPILFLPLLFFPPPSTPATTTINAISHPSKAKITSIYVFLGLLIGGNNLMYSYGLSYLPVSTFSLICATQLAFNAVFSYFLNAQKFTSLIFNSVVLLTLSAILLATHSKGSSNIPEGSYAIGFFLTLLASALFALILSLMELTFQKVLKRETFAIVMEMQACIDCLAALVSVIGLFASGEWRSLKGEMEAFEKGKVAYVLVLVWTAISWQLASVGTMGLIFAVSSLFSNVISTMALPVVPIFAVIFFHDKMDGVKVLAMLIALWGFLSYAYQHYLDDSKAKKAKRRVSITS